MKKRPGGRQLRRTGPLLALLLAACLSFWLAPAPQGQPDVEYWGHYAQVGPGLGFVVNHDSYGYLEVAQRPQRLLRPQEVRQSRPLYALLGAAVGYPLTAVLALAGHLGLAPRWSPADLRFYGFYSGYVVLNGLTLLASLLLFRSLFGQLTAGRGRAWQFYALAWVLVANPITKAFFWTAHQQMLAFLAPLFCLWLALWVERRVLSWPQLEGLSLALGLLPLAYGSFLLVWPALVYGLGRQRHRPAPRWLATRLAASACLFGLPTVLWVAGLRSQGVSYYNHEAVRYHQLVWLPAAWGQPGFAGVVLGQLKSYVRSLQLVGGWLLLGATLLAATWWRRQAALLPRPAGPALGWVGGWFVLFFALLGYYPERLAYTLLPLVLCLLAALLPYWPGRYVRPLVLAVAASWHTYVLLSYGPFS
ncbi:hypothetical protein GCM10023172_31370 [Hymenobacter ginsengisoli]|uniref:Glycosyltransferase RgtA/B/C/D-like domain-containing protein n=1 Tax=Hymenobacter ginsengisoli TaxID=1051626 RepID=A0ABP8QMM5_9BACT|nr:MULTISPECIES: hypothetical protein [unclassified Hymenobacter]MBO2031322.1 hypothetical protein [Hymenobacter sp. BT559]